MSDRATEAFVDELIADMQRLGSRPYSEIGVPTFLVLEDLTGTAAPDPAAGWRERLLASALADAAAALEARKGELTAKDVAQLVEVLADRLFFPLATPAFSQGEAR